MLDKPANHPIYVSLHVHIFYDVRLCRIANIQILSVPDNIPRCKTLWTVKRLCVFNVEMIREIVFIRQNEKNYCRICIDASEVWLWMFQVAFCRILDFWNAGNG